MSAAAAATMTMIAAPIAMYVVVGSGAFGGGAIEGAGVVVCCGAVGVGAVGWVAVGCGVCVTIGAADGDAEAKKVVPASLL